MLSFLQAFTYDVSGNATPYVTSVDYDHNNIIHVITKYALYSYNTSTTGKLALIAGLNPDLTGLPASATTPATPTLATSNTNNLLRSDSNYDHYFNLPANFNIHNKILLKLGNIPSNVYSTSRTQANFHIQVNSNFGNVIYLNTASNVGNVWNIPNGVTLEYLDVTLVDNDNNVIDLHNAEFCFSLGVTYL